MKQTTTQIANITVNQIAKSMRTQLDYSETEPYTWLTTVNRLAALLKNNENFNFHEFRDECGFVQCTGIESARA